MKNWNKATDILKDHQKREYHITASLRADDFLQTGERPEHRSPQSLIVKLLDILRKTENCSEA